MGEKSTGVVELNDFELSATTGGVQTIFSNPSEVPYNHQIGDRITFWVDDPSQTKTGTVNSCGFSPCTWLRDARYYQALYRVAADYGESLLVDESHIVV